MKTIISKNKAQEICSIWHGGMFTALYQFASSKVYVHENYNRYIDEIKDCEAIGKKQVSELNSLSLFFEFRYLEYLKDNKIKTEACSFVLSSMDNSIIYCTALNLALEKFSNVSRVTLEKELNHYI